MGHAMKNKNKKKNLIIFIVIITAVAIGWWSWQAFISKASIFCTSETQFAADTNNQTITPGLITDASGTLVSYNDNFQEYGAYSKLIDAFEDSKNVLLTGSNAEVQSYNDAVDGSSSVGAFLETSSSSRSVTFSEALPQPIDMSQWENSGFITGWINIENRIGIDSVGIKIGNGNNYREFNALPNLQLGVPNYYTGNGPYPDIPYPEGSSTADEWSNYWLNTGWNYLFWQIQPSNYTDYGNFDASNVTWVEVTLNLDPTFSAQNIYLNDFRVQGGLQKGPNPLNGVWYPPLGRPQYGVYDIDQQPSGSYVLNLLNVRQSQYPSNGDHGRMILTANTPENFALRIRYELTNFDPSSKLNTWFRVMYDFDPSYDPGHNWFGTYESLEYSRLGLVTVIPVERFLVQTQEPKEGSSIATAVFSPQENQLYELDLTVHGQTAQSTVYAVNGICLQKKASVSYTFARQRDPGTWPFAVEITGNVKAAISDMDILKL